MIKDITVVTYFTRNHQSWLPHWCKQLNAQIARDFQLMLICHNWRPDPDRLERMISDLDESIWNNLNTYVHHGEQNIGDVINFALGEIDTQYFAHWDVDDDFHPERLMRQAAFLQAHPEIDFLGTRMLGFVGQPKRALLDMSYIKPNEPNARVTTHDEIYDCLLNKGQNCLGHSSMIYKVAAMKKIGGFSHLNVRTDPMGRSPDMETWKKALMAGYKFYRLPSLLCYWRLDSSDIRDTTHIEE